MKEAIKGRKIFPCAKHVEIYLSEADGWQLGDKNRHKNKVPNTQFLPSYCSGDP